MKKTRLYLVLSLLLLTLVACRKDKERAELAPQVENELVGTIWVQRLPAQEELPEDYPRDTFTGGVGPYAQLRVLHILTEERCVMDQFSGATSQESDSRNESHFFYQWDTPTKFTVGYTLSDKRCSFRFDKAQDKIYLTWVNRPRPLDLLDRNIPFVRATWENGLLQAYIKGEIAYQKRGRF